MAKLPLPPTKASLLRLKQDLAFIREGYEMLERKREILVLELMSLVEAAKRAQAEAHEKMARAHATLRAALLCTGTLSLAAAAAAPRPPHAATIQTRSLMGIYLPTLRGEHPAAVPAGSFLAGSAAFDEVGARFREALESIDRLAEIENAVFRLAREVRKTQRRVNALDKVFLPAYAETLAYIGSVLEERERDEFIIMRLLKAAAEGRSTPRS